MKAPSDKYRQFEALVLEHHVRNEIRKKARRQRILHAELVHLLIRRHEEANETNEPLTIEAIRACVAELSPASSRVTRSWGRSCSPGSELS